MIYYQTQLGSYSTNPQDDLALTKAEEQRYLPTAQNIFSTWPYAGQRAGESPACHGPPQIEVYLGGKMNASSKSARAFSSDATTRKISLTERIPRNPCPSSITSRWKIVFYSIKRRQSSSVTSGVTVTSSRVMISAAFIQAGHLFSAATLSETSLCETTPVSLPLTFVTPTERTCFSRRYSAAW